MNFIVIYLLLVVVMNPRGSSEVAGGDLAGGVTYFALAQSKSEAAVGDGTAAFAEKVRSVPGSPNVSSARRSKSTFVWANPCATAVGQLSDGNGVGHGRSRKSRSVLIESTGKQL